MASVTVQQQNQWDPSWWNGVGQNHLDNWVDLLLNRREEELWTLYDCSAPNNSIELGGGIQPLGKCCD